MRDDGLEWLVEVEERGGKPSGLAALEVTTERTLEPKLQGTIQTR
jgi:hypothetical protein